MYIYGYMSGAGYGDRYGRRKNVLLWEEKGAYRFREKASFKQTKEN